MSPRFTPDLTKARAGIRVFDRGDYELKVPVDGIKGICYKKDATKEREEYYVAGVRINIEMVGRIKNDGQLDREFSGEPVTPMRLYVHTEDAWGMSKRAIMAILGYSLEQEDEFNEKWASTADLTIDGEGDNVTLGSGWKQLENQVFHCTLDKEMYDPKDGGSPREQQRHNNPTPAKAPPRRRRSA